MAVPSSVVKVTASSKQTSFLRALSLPLTLTFPPSPPPTARDVKFAIHKAYPSFYISRQKLSLPGISKALSDDSIIPFTATGDAELIVGDLGPQVAWRTVFLVEYVCGSHPASFFNLPHVLQAGPLIIHPLIYHFPRFVYGVDVQHSALQKSVYAMVLMHFAKRELETMFVHRFSHATMPLKNIFKKCVYPLPLHFSRAPSSISLPGGIDLRSSSAHYYIISGVFLACDLYRPAFSAPAVIGTYRDGSFLRVAWVIWGFAELSNLHTHLTTRALRPPGTTTRAVPMGYGFSWPFNLAFPNYFFEMLGWSVVAAMSGSLSAALFVAASAQFMVPWALKKHVAYKREFGDKYPRGRKAIFPGIL
ncbi:3-oxo-5-alpha-steroid 4-dehydrogenase-domain-containing protein [Mycena latifolia]|nr:3-oxo-5-alpha-steroid 4-dehydrogenase-domain-containing protein [Mycena latifolia]